MSDKVYELPDRSVSPFWQNDNGKTVEWSHFFGDWVVRGKETLRPLEGRWKPWTPPTFPPRVKCPRRCWATHSEGRGVFIFFPNHVDRKFRPALKEYSGFVEGSSLTDIVWIDKEEYEDELQGCTTHGDVSRPS